MTPYYRFCKSPVNFVSIMSEKKMDLVQGYANVSFKKDQLYLYVDIYSNKILDQDLIQITGAGFDNMIISSKKLDDDQYMTSYVTRQISTTGLISFTHKNTKESLSLSWHEDKITDPHGFSARIIEGELPTERGLEEIISDEEINHHERLKALFSYLSDCEADKRIEILQEISTEMERGRQFAENGH